MHFDIVLIMWNEVLCLLKCAYEVYVKREARAQRRESQQRTMKSGAQLSLPLPLFLAIFQHARLYFI